MTPESSLIVLETLEQFVKYKVQPPQHLSSIYNKYMSLINSELKKEEKELEEKLFQVQGMWEKR